jgi:TolA-binding protein
LADAQDLGSCTARCRGSTPLSCIPMKSLTILLVILGAASLLHADTLWLKSPTSGKPLPPLDGVKIEKIAKGDSPEDLFYLLPSGQERNKPLEQVLQLKVDDEPALSAAEAAFAAGDMKAAAAEYRKAMSSAKPWVKRRADSRLVQAASKSGDFGDSVLVFLNLVQKTPDAAAKSKPPLTSASPQQRDAAIASVRTALGDAKVEQKQVLLPFLVELYNAKKDTASAQQAMSELTRLNPTAANTAEIRQAKVELALDQARQSLAQKNYPNAISQIESNAALFTEPPQQAEAMWILAECKAATASDDNALKDAALAYMRVVANFKLLPNTPHVADALFQTAQIEEKLKDKKTAALLYNKIAADYKDQPIAQAARQRADALK